MDERRVDHFAYLRQDLAQPAPEADQPIVRPDLVEALEKAFPVQPPSLDASVDGMIASFSNTAIQIGQQQVIAYIRNLVRGA